MLPPVSLDAQPLPMAPSGCGLDDSQLAEQLARYRQLSNSVLGVDARRPDGARSSSSEPIETELLEQTLAIERGCCSFFTLDYDTVRTRPGDRVPTPNTPTRSRCCSPR